MDEQGNSSIPVANYVCERYSDNNKLLTISNIHKAKYKFKTGRHGPLKVRLRTWARNIKDTKILT